jgi:hypothetical protein
MPAAMPRRKFLALGAALAALPIRGVASRYRRPTRTVTVWGSVPGTPLMATIDDYRQAVRADDKGTTVFRHVPYGLVQFSPASLDF